LTGQLDGAEEIEDVDWSGDVGMQAKLRGGRSAIHLKTEVATMTAD
jgi:hypothetical protein